MVDSVQILEFILLKLWAFSLQINHVLLKPDL